MNGRHRAQGSSGNAVPRQLPLAFEALATPGTESALRAAYRRLAISRWLSYEQAMSQRAYEIGIRNLAEAIARRIRHRHSRRGQR